MALLESALKKLAEVKSGKTLVSIPDGNGGVTNSRQQLAAAFKPIRLQLDELVLRGVPDALITSPCGWCRDPDRVRTPLVNLLNCYDHCGLCLAEARRSLELAREAVVRGARRTFLPPEVIAARIRHAQAGAHARASRDREDFQSAWSNLKFMLGPDAGVTAAHGDRASKPLIARTGPDQSSRLEQAIAKLQPYFAHLITWSDLVGYLNACSVRGVAGAARQLGRLGPKPVFTARKRRPYYRLGEALRSALDNAPDYPSRPLVCTPRLQSVLKRPDFRPDWA